ncbi:MAG: PD40 domain-containing protein [Chloroflexi bacterium]|nr:PD40 domain-containing protein [Chloroflexota bacterium]
MKPHFAWKGLLVSFIALVLASFAISSVAAGEPTGTSPNDPLMVPTDWSALAPNTSRWFYFDYAVESSGGGPGFGPRPGSSATRSKVDVSVAANGATDLQFALYTPTQATDWLRDQTTAPVGRGTPYRSTATGEITRDLYWSGAFNTSGRYFVVVTNNTTNTIAFHLTITGEAVTLYPIIAPTPTPTVAVPFTAATIPTGAIQGKLVFQTATGGAIYTVNGDGSNLTLIANGIDPSWSPDGKQITFARWSGAYPGLYVVNADGSNEHLVYGAQRIRSPKWSPDGKYIAFVQDKTTNERDPKWKLGVIELNKSVDGATTKNVLTEPQCSALCYALSWSTDSLTLNYADPNIGIMTTNVITGSASLVLGPQGSYYDTGANVIRPILHMPAIQSAETSPDGARIVYTQKAHDRWEVNVVNADGSNATGITQQDAIMYTFFNKVVDSVAPTWSPDGKQVLFLSNRNGKWEFFVSDADGSNMRQVLKNVTDTLSLRFDFENERVMDWSK